MNVLQHAVTVPIAAIEHGPTGLFVYTVKPDQSVAPVNVKVGYQDNSQAVVTQGLSGGETVVVSGQSRLATGVKVRAVEAQASQAGSGGPEAD